MDTHNSDRYMSNDDWRRFGQESLEAYAAGEPLPTLYSACGKYLTVARFTQDDPTCEECQYVLKARHDRLLAQVSDTADVLDDALI